MATVENKKKPSAALVTLIVGLALNITLGVSKLIAGVFSHSAAVSSDALNNLSDAVVSVVTIIATALAARAADRKHPYGHGRYEYIATFVLGAVIVAVGIEVLRSGIERAITPQSVDFDALVWTTLGASIGIKLFMFVFYIICGKKTGSSTIKAAAVDSISDAAVTTVVLVCALIERYTGARIDGYVSIAVSVVIIVFAVRILKDTVSRLLGERPSPELMRSVTEILDGSSYAVSSHDLLINDYGANKKIAEVDLVFPAELDFVTVHAECDRLERLVYQNTGIRLCVHADPLDCDERTKSLGAAVADAIGSFGATAHDININDAAHIVYLDILVPNDVKTPVTQLKEMVKAETKKIVPYEVEINIDYV